MLRCLISLSVVWGCIGEEAVAEVVSGDWVFPSVAERERHEATRAVLAGRWPDAHHTLVRSGNFLRERWCVEADCSGESVSLAVLHAPPRYPEVFGLVVGADVRDGPVQLVLHASSGGRQVTGDAVTVEVQTPTGALVLGSALAYAVGEKRFTTSALDLGRAVSSPESLRLLADEQLDVLAGEVLAHLDSGLAWRCVDGPPSTGSTPPPCIRTPLTEAELEAARGALSAWRREQAAILDGHGEAAQRLLAGVVPATLR
jgi:hypothetical protein